MCVQMGLPLHHPLQPGVDNVPSMSPTWPLPDQGLARQRGMQTQGLDDKAGLQGRRGEVKGKDDHNPMANPITHF